MKVCVVAPEHPNSSNFGGIARYLRDYLPQLAKQCDVLLISIEDGRSLPGVRQHTVTTRVKLSPLVPYFLSQKIEQIVAEYQPDVVEYSNWIGLACRDNGPWARVVRLSTPVKEGTLRPGVLPILARPLHHLWEKKTVAKAHLVISHSKANYQLCHTLYECNKESVIIPLGFPESIQTISKNCGDVLFVGRFDSRKGVDLVLEAWEIVVSDDSYRGEKLHLVGRDTPGKGKSYLEDCFARNDGILKNCIIHGSIPAGRLQEIRAQCGIAVVPSRYESFGLVVLEAFAAGNAVVASRVGGLEEIIQHNSNGLLFSAGNSVELASRLLSLLNDVHLRENLVKEGQRTLVEKYSISQMVDSSVSAYARAMEIRSTRS